MKQNLPLSRPSVTPLEIERVVAVLESGRLATGPQTRELEDSIRAFCGVEHAVAVSSGTAALHLIVRALGLGPGDEVITTPYSFIASSNVLLFEGIKPVFVDIEPATWNIDVRAVEDAITDRTRGILAVDVFGVPADWPRLHAIAKQYSLHLIDDACEALGAEIGGSRLGAWGDAAAFGFYPNKQITTGEGGCITTSSPAIADFCRSARNQGRSDDRFLHHTLLGYNYRMDEMSAALGCAQLERWNELSAKREAVALRYRQRLAEIPSLVKPPVSLKDVRRSWFVYVVELQSPMARPERDEVITQMGEAGIECAPYFPSIHLQPVYRERFGFGSGTFPVAERVSNQTLALPFYPDLSLEDVDLVVDHLESVLRSMSDAPRAA
jgi:perosamine synthetase